MRELNIRLKEVGDVWECFKESDLEGEAWKKKLGDISERLKQAKQNLEQAEETLRAVILANEKESREIEDAILLTNGIQTVREKETEA